MASLGSMNGGIKPIIVPDSMGGIKPIAPESNESNALGSVLIMLNKYCVFHWFFDEDVAM